MYNRDFKHDKQVAGSKLRRTWDELFGQVSLLKYCTFTYYPEMCNPFTVPVLTFHGQNHNIVDIFIFIWKLMLKLCQKRCVWCFKIIKTKQDENTYQIFKLRWFDVHKSTEMCNRKWKVLPYPHQSAELFNVLYISFKDQK